MVTLSDGALCDDGDPCTGPDLCGQGTCAPGKPKACDDQNPCTTDTCDAKAGCQHAQAADGSACSDGEGCTQNDACQAGACKPGVNVCGCTTDDSCAAKDDGNACNGALYCDHSNAGAPKCVVNPATVVHCPTGGDSACLKNACQPKDGTCVPTPIEFAKQACQGAACDWWVKDGTATAAVIPCDDQDGCTVGDHCGGGQCKPGPTNVCGCKDDAGCAKGEDGNLCNGTLFCNKTKVPATCELNPATVVSCPSVDDTACQKNECHPKTGACQAVAVNDKKGCDDGNPCTKGEVCQAGQCAASTNTCVCKADADCAGQDDGDLCNGVLFCHKQAGTCQVNPASIVNCPSVDDTACQVNQCQAKTGACAFVAINEAGKCSDGNPCTANDACVKGQCVATANTCECQQDGDCKAKEDGDLCNGTLYCKQGQCALNPATLVACSKSFDTSCQHNLCHAQTGTCALQPVNQGLACDDGSKCTAPDVCQNGKCAGAAADCEDDVVCTLDACDALLGCTHKTDAALCDDADACTLDTCLGAVGCSHKPATGPCDDGDKCTGSDACAAGACLGKALVCDDQNPCSDSQCAKATGCVHLPNAATCATGEPCTPWGLCAAAACKALPAPLHDTLVDGKGDDTVAAVLAADLGHAVVVGATTSQGKGKRDVWVARLDAGGAVVAQVAIGTAADEGAAAAVALQDGGAALAGWVNPGPLGSEDAFFVRVGLDGVAVWKQVAGGKGADAAEALATFGKDDLVAAGRTAVGADSQWWLVRLSGVGTLVWDKALSLAGTAYGVGALPGGGFAVAGDKTAGAAGPVFSVVRTDAAGKELWAKSFDGLPGGARAVVALADGTVMAGGFQGAKQDAARLVRLDAKGGVLLDQLLGGTGAGAVTALHPVGPGVLAFAGRKEKDGAPHLWLGRVDVLGKLVWARTHGVAPATANPAVAVLPSGAHVLATTWSGTGADGFAARVVRTDPWGYASCLDQGDCALKTVGACDDQNPCTHDACLALLGCVHTVNALPCDDANPCTEDDTCDGGACAKASSGSCDDGNACTTDLCDSAGGCAHSHASSACDDGSACTKGDACALGLCKPGAAVPCNDGNACTDDSCDPKKGCKQALNQADCEAGACTYGDVCDGGFCKSSGKPAFVDGWSGGAWNDRARRVVQVGETGFVLATDTYPNAHPDAVVVRLDPAGKKLWETTVKHPDADANDYGQAVVPFPAGFLMAGQTSGCNQRALLARLDTTGKLLWTKLRAPTVGDGDCNGYAERGGFSDIEDGQDGTFAAVGWRHLVGTNEVRGWFQRVDQDGAVKSSQAYFGAASTSSGQYDIERAAGGGYVTCGYTTHQSAGGYDGQVVRTDGAGGVTWWVRLGGAGHDYFLRALSAPDGGAWAVGRTASKGAGLDDGWVARLDPSGKVLWERTYGGAAADGWVGAAMFPGGRLVLAGHTLSQGAGGTDAWLMGIDTAGQPQWQTLWGGPGDDVWNDVELLKSGGLAVTGYGQQPKQTQQDVRLVVTDAFGHVGCAAAGGCAAKTPLDCDDKNPCTADTCTAAQGCTATALTDGTVCDGAKKCAAGVCK